ncbi:hypothetical protein [Microlunatus parietis]|uniref:Uncharacterized protein n=1 Tax=Microlunatus parietis TaxID=682979 RepID=A0A7Y9LC01_9ACTN|nr:hypothetical protein [Microlunatus parietis]NYE71368.1 hypothetical protein [Microlunatus parietis]
MATRPGARRPGVIIALAAGVAACALTAAIANFGLPGLLPPGCVSISISVEAGSVGEPTPEAALDRWLDTGASPRVPRQGWSRTMENGLLYLVNGPHRVEILDLSTGGGSGWTVTAANCSGK